MARMSLPVKRRTRARRIEELSLLLVYVEAGFDLPEARRRAGCEESGHAADLLWQPIVAELHAHGAPLRDALVAWCEELRREEERDLESFRRELPGRLNVWLVVFLVPAMFLVLLPPLLFALSAAND